MSKKYKVFLAVGLCCLSLTGCTSAYEAYEEGYKDALHDAEDYVQEEIVMFYEGLLDECYEQVPASRKFLKNIDYYMDVDFDWPCKNPYESRNERVTQGGNEIPDNIVFCGSEKACFQQETSVKIN